MTFIWFVVWLVANTIGDNEGLSIDPVNVWTGALILAVALDLGRQHAPEFGKPGPRAAKSVSEKVGTIATPATRGHGS